MNSYGNKFRISVFGESHGEAIGVVADGVPAGIALKEEDFLYDLSRRKSGGKGTTPRRESDLPNIVSGVFNGYTTGAPVALLFRNENTRSSDYSQFREIPRPGHSDFVAGIKYGGFNDIRGGGHFSGRLTLTLVAAGVLAKKAIDRSDAGKNIKIEAELVELGGTAKDDSVKWDKIIEEAISEGDSVGGIVECRCSNVPAGLGEPFFDSLESQLSHLLFSIPGVRGVEFGDGFAASRMKGSEHNDPIMGPTGKTGKNGAGGINGGISNGNPIVFRVAVKPTSSISKTQRSFNFTSGQIEEFNIKGRHDACIALRVPVIAEAVAAIVLANNL